MSPSRSLLRSVARAAGLVLSVLGLVFVGRTLARDWPAVREALRGADGTWLAAALVVAAAAFLLIAVNWRRAVRAVGAEVPVASAVSLYFRGEIAKYVPGGVWAVLGRGELLRRSGIAGAPAYASVMLSLAALYLAASAWALVALPLRAGDGGTPLLVLLVLPVGLVLLHPRLVGAGLHMARRLSGRALEVRPPGWGTTAALVAAYLPAWLGIGAVSWLLARALDARAGLWDMLFATAVAWLAGFLAVPVPGGIGVREATFVVLTASLSEPVAGAVAVLARAAFVLVDAAGAVVASAADRFRSRSRVAG